MCIFEKSKEKRYEDKINGFYIGSCSVLVACDRLKGEEPIEPSVSDTEKSSQTETVVETESRYMPEIAKKNYGDTLYVQAYSGITFLWTEESDSSLLSEAVYQRQVNLYNHLGVEMVCTPTEGWEGCCKLHFPTAIVDYYEDRDKSGYTFDQRPSYYYDLRPKLFRGEYDILIVKDLSRFSRRTGKGLAEFEDLAEKDIRIIAIGDDVDYDQEHTEDWMKIKLYFFVNEMPVTDASRKVSDVIANRQAKGEWICTVPYGYVFTNTKK